MALEQSLLCQERATRDLHLLHDRVEVERRLRRVDVGRPVAARALHEDFERLAVLRHPFRDATRLGGGGATGSYTSSNVLFGSLQKITATQLESRPTLMAAANSSGGVMGR